MPQLYLSLMEHSFQHIFREMEEIIIDLDRILLAIPNWVVG